MLIIDKFSRGFWLFGTWLIVTSGFWWDNYLFYGGEITSTFAYFAGYWIVLVGDFVKYENIPKPPYFYGTAFATFFTSGGGAIGCLKSLESKV